MMAGWETWRRRLAIAAMAAVGAASLAGLRAAAGQSATDGGASANPAAGASRAASASGAEGASPSAAPAAGSASPAATASRAARARRAARVRIVGFRFRPTPLRIKRGTRVVFVNRDSAAHTATANGGGFDTGRIGPRKSASVTFKRRGSFRFHCTIHPGMRGKVVVRSG